MAPSEWTRRYRFAESTNVVCIRSEEMATIRVSMLRSRNASSGICGSDLHEYFSPEPSGLDFTKPHPVTGSLPPQILGHEFSGTIVELGKG